MIRELVGYPFGDVTNIQGDDLLVINQMESVSCYGICVKYSNDDLLLSKSSGFVQCRYSVIIVW